MDTHPHHVAAALHLAGFLCGLTLYGMLLVLSLRDQTGATGLVAQPAGIERLPVFTGMLGMVWNAGAMVVHGLADFGMQAPPVALVVATYTALGFLPAAVAHSIVRPSTHTNASGLSRALVVVAYSLSSGAAVLHVHAAMRGALLPSGEAFRLLTAGYVLLTVPIVIAIRRQALWRRTLVVVALGVFGVSAIHLVDHQDFTSPLWVQVLGHHAALPLAVAILVQDYRFAFGDLLLKRMLSLGLLVGLALGGYFLVLRLPIAGELGADLDRPEFIAAVLSLSVGLALLYPWIRARAGIVVDRMILRRSDPGTVLAALTQLAADRDQVEVLVADAGHILAAALSAPPIRWTEQPAPPGDGAGPAFLPGASAVSLEPDGRCAHVVIPAAEAPRPTARIGPLAGGRRLLAADIVLLRDAAQVLARRIDAVRLAQERWERRWRDEELARLAVDAELRALRAQINPHFLFNALTTIGYLVNAAPDRALHTLLRLTEVLRRALRPDEDVVTLAGELQLVEAYLDIERARFEERLSVVIDVPDDIRHVRMPAFVLQPLVENAVKHGIAPSRTGGLVSLRARVLPSGARLPSSDVLEVTVSDTGRGRAASAPDHGGQGIGLANVRRRLELAYGAGASLRFTTAPDIEGSEAVVTIPCPEFRTAGGQDAAPRRHEDSPS